MAEVSRDELEWQLKEKVVVVAVDSTTSRLKPDLPGLQRGYRK